MVENRSSLFGIIAIIIGASGLGLGAFSVVNYQVIEGQEGPQGPPGEDGEDGIPGQDGKDGNDAPIVEEIYYCSNQTEIEDALDTIGSGNGMIIITENITLTSTLTIDDGGYYIIQGAGFITLDRNADDETFNISYAKYCIIKDLIIDVSDITSETISGILISEGNNNPVYIQNVQIHGGNGRGIFVNSENVWIENCFIHDVRIGILVLSNRYCHILDSSLSSCILYGIQIWNSDSNTISGNIIHDVSLGTGIRGIYLINSDFNTINGNLVHDISSSSSNTHGILLSSSISNTVSDNVVYAISSSDLDAGGIVLSSSSNFNTISGNTINDISSSNNTAHGISLDSSDKNSVGSNNVYSIIGADAIGISLLGVAVNTFTGNLIHDIVATFSRYGFYGSGFENVIVGNALRDTGGINVAGAGNVIADNVVVGS